MTIKKNIIFSKLKIIIFISLIVLLDIGISLIIFKPKWQNNNLTPLTVKVSPAVSITSNTWSLLITGDVIPARSVNFQMTAKNDFMWSLKGIKDVLQNADLTLINLESPLISNCPLINEGMIFCGNTKFAQSLKESGVDVVNLANNHSLNYGWEGLGETEKLLNDLSIDTVGYTSDCIYSSSEAEGQVEKSNTTESSRLTDVRSNNNIFCSSVAIKTVNNINVGFLGYNTVGQKLDRELVNKQITDLRKKVDVLVISVHWGKEYEKNPVAESEDPKELGKWLIDLGADIIVGNHPHQIQPYEFYQNGVIFYALGNTVFDQEWSEETKKGNLIKLYFNGIKLQPEKLEIIPIGIRNYGEAYIP